MKNKKYDKMYVYITGFGVFGDEMENPTEKLIYIIKDCEGKEFNTIYTTFKYADVYEVNSRNVDEKIKELEKEIKDVNEKEGKDNVICVILNYGLSASAKEIKVETVAKNYLNENPWGCKLGNGNKPRLINESLSSNHKISTKINIPMLIKTLKENKANDNIKCGQSFDAGTYLCNYLMYKSIEFSYLNENVFATFIHVPLENVLSLEDGVLFLKLLIVALETMYINK